MLEWSFRCRVHPLARTRSYRLADDALIVREGERESRVRFADITLVESFHVRVPGSSQRQYRHVLHPLGAGQIMLQGIFRDRWRVVDNSAELQRFCDEMFARIDAANPDFQWLDERHWTNRARGLGGKLGIVLIDLVRRTSPDRCKAVAAWLMRRIGPRLRGHRHAIEQIALAFPDKSAEECQRIAVGMWDNLARTAIEYAQLQTLWPRGAADPERSRINWTDANAQVWDDIRSADRRTLHFAMHSANWELAAVIAGSFARGYVLYRPLKNPALTEEIVRIRAAAGPVPILAGPSLISRLRREFGPRDGLGMLIDQRYVRGVEVNFFNRPTILNPLFARIARIYDCPIYGSRVIRQPDGRFDYEIVPVDPKRDARGRIDVNATTQLLASIMERWIREHPEQWMWLHRLWR